MTLCTEPLPKVVSPTRIARLQILERAGHDFGAARAAVVHQNRERDNAAAPLPRPDVRIFVLLRWNPAFGGNDLRVRR